MQAARHRFRVVSLVLFAGLVSILLGALASGTAYAAPLRVASFFGKTGSGNGEFSSTTGVGGLAVNRTGAGGVEPGSVYVVDRGGNRVERFAPNPLTGAYEFKASFGAKGTQGLQFETPQSVAVDQATGAVYVLDGANERLQKFSATGAFLWAVGQNVLVGGAATGTVLCTEAAKCQKGTAGTLGGTFGVFNATAGGGVAVDPTSSDVDVTDPGNNRVQEFTSNGAFVRAFGWDVVKFGAGNAGTAAVQSVKVPSESGTFSLAFESQTTGGAGTGNLSATSKEVTAVTSTGTFVVGESISGEGIPAGTAITAVGTGTLTLSAAATATKTGVALAANLSATSTPTQVETALNALSTIGGAHGSVTVAGGPGDAGGSHPYEVTFGGSLRGEALGNMTASSGGLASPIGSELKCTGGPVSATLKYEWLANGAAIAGAVSSTYTTQPTDAGKALQCRVLAETAEGATAKVSTGAPIVASPYPAIAPPTPGTPTVSGTAEAGKKLTCATGTWTPASPTPTFTFQWLRNGASLGSAHGAQTNEYEIQSTDLGASIQCEVTGSNLTAGGGAAVADSTGTIPLAVSPANTGLPATAPVVADTTQTATPPVAGDVLSCTSGTWTGASGFKYQWLSGGAAATGSGAQTASYTVAAADAGKAIQCLVTAENAQGKASAVSANLVAQTPPSPLPPVRPTTAISVTGTHTVGQTLTCTKGTWTNNTGIEYTYAWLRNNQAISGSTTGPTTASNGTYKLVTADEGTEVQCQITATTATGSSVALSPTAAVISPAISTATATLSGAPAIAVTTTTAGTPAFEVCTVAEGCKGGVNATANSPGVGEFANAQPTRLAVDSSGDVYTVESAITFRVQKFVPAGASLTPEVFAPSVLNGTAASSTPTDVAIEPTDQNALVSKAYTAAQALEATGICPTGVNPAAERRILEVGPSGSPLETGMTCTWNTVGSPASGISSVNGLATGSGGTLFVSSATPEQRVYVLNSSGAAPPPAATIEDASAVGTRGATLNANITALCPSPLLTGYHFEYRRDEAGAPWVNVPSADTAATATGQVSASLTGLEANQSYRVRLALNCQFGSASFTSGEKKSFATATLPVEELTTLEPWPIGDAFATLRGQINPNNTAAQWRFQYVDDATFQADQPNGFEHARETSVETATGGVAEEVSLEAGELEPSTTYHYRLVAENGLGPKAFAPERTFITFRESAADLQAPRAYELVSSADKHGADAMTSPLVTANHSGVTNYYPLVAPSGGVLAWGDSSTGPNPLPTNGADNEYRSVRDPGSGWEVGSLAPTGASGSTEFLIRAASADLSTMVLEANTYDPTTGERDVREELLYREADGQIDTIGTGTGTELSGIGTLELNESVHLSPDGSHVFFDTKSRLLPEDTAEAGAPQLYEWTKEGGLQLAGVDGAGKPISPCGSALAGIEGKEIAISAQDVSNDGSSVYFNSPASAAASSATCEFGGSSATAPTYASDLYLRNGEDGKTVDLSRPPGANPDVGSRAAGQPFGASFVGMAPAGGAYFVSGSKLTSDDPDEGATGGDLYRYDPARDVNEVQKLNVKGSAGSFTVTYPTASGYASTNSSTTITNLRSASGAFHVGDAISGTGIQAGTTITAVDPTTGNLTISLAATSTGDNRRLVASGTTGALAFDVPAAGGSGATASFENALNELPGLEAGGGSVSVSSSGSPTDPAGATYAVAFTGGPLADTAQPLLSAAGAGGAATTVEPSVVGGHVTRLSVAQPGGEPTAGVGEVGASGGVPAIASEDGTHVYFTAKGQLVPAKGKTAVENGSTTRNLYLWAEGQGLTFVATIAEGASDGARRNTGSSSLVRSHAAVNPDGSDLVFSSKSKLTGYDNEGDGEFYRYDAPTGEISCVSCSPTGAPPNGPLSPYFGSMFGGAEFASVYASQIGGLSDDGSTVFFASTDQLLPAASNLAVPAPVSKPIFDIYAWHDGRLSLVSSGTSSSSDFLIGASASGREAFFMTSSQLLPRDRDHAYDIYSYTTEGGFPEASVPSACDPLAGSGCQGAPAGAPPAPGASSSTFSGPISPQPKPGRLKPKKHPKKKSKHTKKRHQRHSRRARTNRRTAR